MKLSVCLITKNEEANLSRTLTSVQGLADEIVILDSGSTDATLGIARSFSARIYEEPWKGYGAQKNAAIEKCHGEWILQIDADEEISRPLREKIREIIQQPDANDVYRIKIFAVCFGKRIRFGGWRGFYRVKLFKRNAGTFNDKLVHEVFVPAAGKSTTRLTEEILHHTYRNLDDYLQKCERYTTEGSLEYFKRGRKAGLLLLFFSPLSKFFKMYLLKLGFLDGREGLILALLSAMSNFLKFLKLRELEKARKVTDSLSAGFTV